MPAHGQGKRHSAATQLEGKPAKRTRVSRACDQCRIAREKCDGQQPTCSTCSGTSRRCSYTASPKKRGIQPGYIRTLELALAWLFQQNPENEQLLNDKLAQEGPSSVLISRDSKESNKLHRRWRKAKFYTDVDKQLSGGEPSRHEQSEPLSPHTDDDDSEVEESVTVNLSHNEVSIERLQADIDCTAKVPKQMLATTITTTEGVMGNAPVTTLLPPDSWKLLDTYFIHTQAWLPICEKHDVLKLAYSYPTHGFALSADQPGSGSHAELWSIFAVASLYDASNGNSYIELEAPSTRSIQLYATARSLVPNERNCFDIGHIKALLNLAVFNMAQSLIGAAWLLVGGAYRALEIIDQSMLMTNPRRKHVYLGCSLLEGLLALQLNRRPYIRKTDLEYVGTIDEDGLEEWEPWNFDSPSHERKRTPLLSLSAFNKVVDLIDIFTSMEQSSTIPPLREDVAVRLETWRMSLPAKLDYMRSDTTSTLFTPPATLLKVTYCCASFVSNPSDSKLHRLLQITRQCHDRLRPQYLPPPILCLIEIANRHSAHLVLSDATWSDLQRLRTDIMMAWPRSNGQDHTPDHPVPPLELPATAMQMPTPDSLQSILSNPEPTGQLRSIPLNTYSETHLTIQPPLAAPSPSHVDPRYPEATGDLESFFDELASLDSAARPDNQPQFMQNLGFGPEASMADLFSEYIPLQSSAFLTPDDTAPVGFDQYGFYDAS